MSLQFLLTALVVVLIPGTGVLYTLAIGLGQGRGPAVWAAAGCTLGIVPHLGAAIFGLSALLHTSAVLFAAVKWAGVAYLLYLAWQALRAGGSLNVTERTQTEPGLRTA
ncbi:MAG: LysE family translocator, partial [Pseudomonadota bacterium]